MSTGLKTFLILLTIVVFGAIAYLLVGGESSGPEASSPLQTSTGAPVSGLADVSVDVDAEQIGQEFLTQLLNIRSIKLRDDVFSRPAFVSLVDFTIELVQPGNEGRDNPFAPFGYDSADQQILDPITGLPVGLEGDASAENNGVPVIGSGTVTPIIPSSFNSSSTSSGGSSFTPSPSNQLQGS